MAVIFTDTFTVAIDTDLAAHAPDVGTAWAEAEDTGTNHILAQNTGDVCRPNGNTTSGRIVYTCTPAPATVAYDVWATFNASGSSADDPMALIGRYVDVD